MTNECRTTRKLNRLGQLDRLPQGTIVMVSAPEPLYFLRSGGGWQASDAAGDSSLHSELVRDLPGWPSELASSDLRRPVYVVTPEYPALVAVPA